MSQQNISVDNLTTTTLATYLAQAPNIKNAYVYSATDLPGVVAANNFLSIANPVGNTKTIVLLGAFISTYVASGMSSTRNSIQGGLATAISGGTLAGAATIAKFESGMGTPTAECRINNPAATIGANFFNSPPAIGASTSQYVHSVGYGASTASGPVVLHPGEGLVFHTAVGNTSQTWNISISWGEF